MPNYYQYLQWSVQSLLEHNKVTKLYVFTEDGKLPYTIPCDYEVIKVPKHKFFTPDNPNMNSHYTWISMARMLAPELIPNEDKLMYLDVDTIICDSLIPLWETDLTGKWFGCIPEVYFKPFGCTYYNAGVLLMNLKQMRQDNATKLFMNELNHFRYQYHEQDVLNKYAVPDNVVAVDTRYNESNCCGFTDNPAIIHYAGCFDWYKSKTVYRWEYRERYSGVWG